MPCYATQNDYNRDSIASWKQKEIEKIKGKLEDDGVRGPFSVPVKTSG